MGPNTRRLRRWIIVMRFGTARPLRRWGPTNAQTAIVLTREDHELPSACHSDQACHWAFHRRPAWLSASGCCRRNGCTQSARVMERHGEGRVGLCVEHPGQAARWSPCAGVRTNNMTSPHDLNCSRKIVPKSALAVMNRCRSNSQTQQAASDLRTSLSQRL